MRGPGRRGPGRRAPARWTTTRSSAAGSVRTARAATAGTAAATGLSLSGRTFAPHGGRRGGDGRQIHRFDGSARNLMADVALDIRQGNGVFLATETDGIALGARARRASDA